LGSGVVRELWSAGEMAGEPMKDKFRAQFPKSDFGVDAGMIGVLDAAWVKENGGDPEDDGTTTISLPKPGKYKVTVKIRGCWRGSVKATGIIEAKGNRLVVGDPCYSWSSLSGTPQDVWDKILRDTNFFRKRAKVKPFVVADTGGDGCFATEVEVEEV